MARVKRAGIAEGAAGMAVCPDDLEKAIRLAIYEHRRLASLADTAYADRERAGKGLRTGEERFSEVNYRYARAMLAMRLQQEELSAMIDQLGYVPKNSD